MITPNSIPRSYMLGAMAGSRKCWLACKPAITSPLREKISVEIRSRRMIWVTSCCCSRENPGATTLWTSGTGQYCQQQCNPAGNQEHQVGDAREQIPGGLAVLFLQSFSQHRDEGDRQRPTRDECKQQVGQVIGSIEGIQFGGEPELPGGDDLAHKPQRLLQPEENRHDQGRFGKAGHGASIA